MNARAPLRYTLTRQDALAYENLRGEMPGPQRVLYFLWLGLAGLLLAALPEDIAGTTWSARFFIAGTVLIGAQYLLFLGARALLRRNRARHRYPQPTTVKLERADDHFIVTENGKQRIVRFEAIGMLLPTASHLFIAVERDLVIVPMAAFSDASGMTEMVNAVDGFMREKYANQHASDADAVVTDDADPDGPPAGA
jgi:hypothetical protein